MDNPGKSPLAVSLVVPIFNERNSIVELIDSLMAQSRKADEVILVDAGSTDDTVAIIEKQIALYPSFRLVRSGRAMPGEARNIGGMHARFEWIAFTDAGIRLDKNWLEELVKKAEEVADAAIIYGDYDPEIRKPFDKWSAITFVSPKRPGVIRGQFIASCLLKKEVLNKVGGFPKWRAAEDLIFMEKAEQLGCKSVAAPAAKVYWQLRPDLSSAFKKFHTYSTHNVWAGRQAYWHYPVARQYAVLLVIMILGFVHSWYWFLLLPAWLIARVTRRIYMHRYEFGKKEIFNPLTFFGVALVTLTMDLGTFRGWIKALLTPNPNRGSNKKPVDDPV